MLNIAVNPRKSEYFFMKFWEINKTIKFITFILGILLHFSKDFQTYIICLYDNINTIYWLYKIIVLLSLKKKLKHKQKKQKRISNMKKNQNYVKGFLSSMKEAFFEGFKKVLPFIIFASILVVLFGLLLQGIEIIEKLFPKTIVDMLNLPEPIVKSIEVLIVCILILEIGIISKQENMSKRFEKWLIPVIHRIPLLGFLYKITNQVSFNLKNTNIFKEAVYVEVFFGIYKMGFVTGDSPKSCCKAVKIKGMKSVVIPYYPFTSAELWDVDPKRIKPTGMTVAEATAYLISLKTAMSKNKQEKVSKKNWRKRRRNRRKREKKRERTQKLRESHSETEWGFFYCFS